MATSGDFINYSNSKSLIGTSWNKKVGMVTSAGSYTYVVCAPAIEANLWICGSGWWGYQEGGISAYPYDESTGTFSTKASFDHDGSVSGGSNKSEWTFRHNHGGGSSGDIHDCHIWKINFYLGNNDGTKGFWLYAGGLGLVSESLYNSYFRERLIYYSPAEFWRIKSGNTYTTADACLKAQFYNVRRGTPISISTGTYKYITAREQ